MPIKTLHNRMPWAGPLSETEPLLDREWLVTNGLGGYASGTVSGVTTRRYHGLLIAALPAPFGRFVMLNHLSEQIRCSNGTNVRLTGEEQSGKLELHGASHLADFRLDQGLPVWRYEIDGIAIEKQVVLTHLQNTVHVIYRLVSGEGPVRLKLRPAVHFRPHEMPVSTEHAGPYTLHSTDGRYELSAGKDLPPLRMTISGERPAFTVEGQKIPEVLYRMEQTRGYESTGSLWCPGYFRVDLVPDKPATLVASTETWEVICALGPQQTLTAEAERRSRLIAAANPAVREGPAGELVVAADQFIIQPAGRIEDSARARATGDEVRTVIAGYHWFTDWGRDTMISLEGLTLTTGRQVESGYILRTFAHYIRDGLIPNLFPEGEKEGLYHTADATLWFFHALARYLENTGDRPTLQLLLPKVIDIAEHHLRGTRFGIGVDPSDGLLRQGAAGYQLTWMDAKVGDWVVTPRRGKAVEINALWYNALKCLESWVRAEQGDQAAARWSDEARRVQTSFNDRFWNHDGGYLYDVVDAEGGGNDASCRPNQIFAVSLPHPVLDPKRWNAVVNVVTDRLLTPVGLRSLAPGSPDYKAKYYGELRARDAAYHQGTVWAWLIGPYIDAFLKVHPQEREQARRHLCGFFDHMHEACIGSVSEIFDAEEPFTPRGCIAQAWSVAEVLRCWEKTAGD